MFEWLWSEHHEGADDLKLKEPRKGASPNYFGKDNVILTLGGGRGGGGVRDVTFSDCTE